MKLASAPAPGLKRLPQKGQNRTESDWACSIADLQLGQITARRISASWGARVTARRVRGRAHRTREERGTYHGPRSSRNLARRRSPIGGIREEPAR
ncbi:MAG: hypothetical protein KC613_16440, partial [Myxococcales bacterium]|nr:hypothetical protein [Myxococcales bacterium]